MFNDVNLRANDANRSLFGSAWLYTAYRSPAPCCGNAPAHTQAKAARVVEAVLGNALYRLKGTPAVTQSALGAYGELRNC